MAQIAYPTAASPIQWPLAVLRWTGARLVALDKYIDRIVALRAIAEMSEADFAARGTTRDALLREVLKD